jgi:hypothetical protein
MKILALEKDVPGIESDRFAPHLKAEASKVWELTQSGVLREVYFRKDRRSAVLMLECSDEAEARRILGDLPLVREGLTEFEIIPLEPYDGLSRLFR